MSFFRIDSLPTYSTGFCRMEHVHIALHEFRKCSKTLCLLNLKTLGFRRRNVMERFRNACRQCETPETIVSLHRLVAYVRSVACSLRAFTASVTKSSPPAVLTLDAMLDLCCRCCKGLAWHPEFPSTVI